MITTPTILSGIEAREHIQNELTHTIASFTKKPTLVIIQVGDRSDSNTYINQKKSFAEKIGARVIHDQYSESVSQEEIIQKIDNYNADTTVHGIIVQIPLPAHLDKEAIINAIHPAKDVDGLTTHNTKLLFDGKKGIIPATSRGIISLLSYYKIEITGKHVVVIGRSSLVGKPTALALLNLDATVTVAHKHTQNLKSITKQADILIVAIGDPEFITQDYTHKDQIVIDVGINVKNQDVKPENELSKRKVVGDVAADVKMLVKAISPVPGGVGPMTVASLFQNLVESCVKIEKI